jgi:hypothetical protein
VEARSLRERPKALVTMGLGAPSFVVGLFLARVTPLAWTWGTLTFFYEYLLLTGALILGGFYAFRWGSRDRAQEGPEVDRPLYETGLFFFSVSIGLLIIPYLPLRLINRSLPLPNLAFSGDCRGTPPCWDLKSNI